MWSSLAVLLALAPGPASAAVTGDEFSCELKTSIAAWRYGAKRASCVMGCQRDVRAGSGNPTDCVPPFGGSTQGCVNGSAGKTQGNICKACASDPPECYPDGNCPALADDKLALIEAHIDAILAATYCDDSGSGDGLTPGEGKCQDVVAKYVSKFATQKSKCLARCRKAEISGNIPAGSCDAGAVTDQRTLDCISKAELGASARIDKGCQLGAETPECFGAQTPAGWVADGEQAVDDEDPSFFCESPSGAFLDPMP